MVRLDKEKSQINAMCKKIMSQKEQRRLWDFKNEKSHLVFCEVLLKVVDSVQESMVIIRKEFTR